MGSWLYCHSVKILKMQTMRKIGYILCFVLTLALANITLTSCHEEEKNAPAFDDRLVGTWVSQDNNKDFHEEIAFTADGNVSSTLYAKEKALNAKFIDANGVCHKVKGNFCTEDEYVKLSKIQVYDYEEYDDWEWHGLEILENASNMSYLMQAHYSISTDSDTLILHSKNIDGVEDNIYIRKK